MKTILFVATLLFSTAMSMACAQQPSATPSAAMTAEILALENQIWQHWKDRKFDSIQALLAPQVIFMAAGGASTADHVMKQMRASQCSVTGVTLRDAKTQALAPDTVLIVFVSDVAGTCEGKPVPSDANSSVWVKRGSKWLLMFHHQSPAEKIAEKK